MTDTIEKLVIKIQSDVDDALKGIDEVKGDLGNLENKTNRTSKSMMSLANAIKAASIAAAAALGALSWKMVNLASDAAEVSSKFEAVFKDSTAAAEKWSVQFATNIGRSKNEVKKYMATFQDTFVPMGFARDESALLSEQLTELAVDLASFNNESEPETIASLQSALVGNHETMRRYGVVITQTTLGQELMNMGIAKGVQGATEQQKVQARLNIIMNGTADAQGDAARTADQFANQMRTLKSRLNDVMVEAGDEAMNDLTDTLIEFNEWGTSGGYDNITMFLEDVSSVAADAAKGVAILTTSFADLYATLVSDGPMTEAMGTSGTMPDNGIFDIDALSEEQLINIYQQLGFSEDEIAAKMEHRNELLKDGTNEIEDQLDAINKLKDSSSSIPGWAGKRGSIDDYSTMAKDENGEWKREYTDLGQEQRWGDIALNSDTGEWGPAASLNEMAAQVSSDDDKNVNETPWLTSGPELFPGSTFLEQAPMPTITPQAGSQSQTGGNAGKDDIGSKLDEINSTLKEEPRKVNLFSEVTIHNYSDVAEFEKTHAKAVASGVSGDAEVE